MAKINNIVVSRRCSMSFPYILFVMVVALFAVEARAVFAEDSASDNSGRSVAAAVAPMPVPSTMPAALPSLSAKKGLKPFRVLFATTRLNEGTTTEPEFGLRRNLGLTPVTLGSAHIEAPDNLSLLTKAPTGKLWQRAIRHNHSDWKGAEIESIKLSTSDAFYKEIADWKGTIIVYTHGYKKPFDEALTDIATLASAYNERNPGKPCLPILFSWPSIAARTEYTSDVANLEWSYSRFRDFLDHISQVKNPDATLNLVGHSLGNRYIMAYCTDRERAQKMPVIQNIFMCSADVDYHAAEQSKDELQKAVANKLFILVSDKDRPLIMSHYLHGQPRLGRPVDLPRMTRPRYDLLRLDYWAQAFNDAKDLLTGVGYTNPPEVLKWLKSNPTIEKEFGDRAQFIDVSDIMKEDGHHALAWPVVAELMSKQPKLNMKIVHKRPDHDTLKQCNGTPTVLYRFHRVVPGVGTVESLSAEEGKRI